MSDVTQEPADDEAAVAGHQEQASPHAEQPHDDELAVAQEALPGAAHSDRVEPELPPELAQLLTVVRTEVRREVRQELSFYKGPLPPPAMLKQYEEVLPGLAERIVKSFEAEGPHRRAMEEREMRQLEKTTEARIKVMMRGQWIALAIAIGWLLVVVSLALIGLKWPSALLGSMQLIGFVLYFLFGQRRKKEDTSIVTRDHKD